MTESIDDGARRAWQGHRSAVDPTAVARMVEQRVQERRRQTIRFVASAAIIVPSWIAIFWLAPDLRPVSSVGLMVGAVLGGLQLRRHRQAAASAQSAGASCAAYQANALRQERDFHQLLSTWGMLAMLAGQVAIVTTLLTNPRFEKNPFFAGSLTAFIFAVVAVLAFVFRRARKMVGELDQELSALAKGVEA